MLVIGAVKGSRDASYGLHALYLGIDSQINERGERKKRGGVLQGSSGDGDLENSCSERAQPLMIC